MARPKRREVRPSRRRSFRRSRRAEPTDAVPLELGGVVRQAGLFASANGLFLGCESVAVGVVIGLVAILGRPVARLLRWVTRR